jgi:hypothetical protein
MTCGARGEREDYCPAGLEGPAGLLIRRMAP